MQISQSQQGDALILTIAGRLDNNGSDLFREKALTEIKAGATLLIVDFSAVDYVASMGIRALFIPAQELARRNGKIVLCGLNSEIRSLFTTAGLFDLFEVFDTVESAVAKAARA